MRLGIFGGTFDPPHFGHLALASAAHAQLKLDKVLWVVAGQSPLKQDRPLSPAEIRVEMVQAAIAGEAAFALSRVDLDRPGPHYTIDTLEILSRQFPGAELYFLMGEDSLRDLPKWRRPGDLIRLARLAVLGRPGAVADLDDLEGIIPGLAAHIAWVESPRLAIASSDIQRRVRQGQSVDEMVSREVRAVIEREQLYKR